MFQYVKKMNEPGASLLLLLLIMADCALIVFFVISETIIRELCHPLQLCGSMHIYNLIKLFWVILLLINVLISTGCRSYISWIVVFIWLLLDDVLLLHQKIGGYLSTLSVDHPLNTFNLSPRFFELTVLAFTAMLLSAVVVWSCFHGPDIFKKISIDILIFLSALVFFGSVVDLTEMIGLGHTAIFGLGFVEDGGELVTYSLIVWYVFLLALRKGELNLFLHNFLFKTFIRTSALPASKKLY